MSAYFFIVARSEFSLFPDFPRTITLVGVKISARTLFSLDHTDFTDSFDLPRNCVENFRRSSTRSTSPLIWQFPPSFPLFPESDFETHVRHKAHRAHRARRRRLRARNVASFYLLPSLLPPIYLSPVSGARTRAVVSRTRYVYGLFCRVIFNRRRGAARRTALFLSLEIARAGTRTRARTWQGLPPRGCT